MVVCEACHQDKWGCLGETSDGICQLTVLKDKQVIPQQKRREASTMGQRFVIGGWDETPSEIAFIALAKHISLLFK